MDYGKSGAPMPATPSWLTPPTGPATQAFTTYTNPQTGEQFTAPTGGYTINVSQPPSGGLPPILGNQPVPPNFESIPLTPGVLEPIATPPVLGGEKPSYIPPQNRTPAPGFATGFWDSPEYLEFQNSPSSGIGTADMYYSPYFGEMSSGSIGRSMDRAYESYLNRMQNAGTPAPILGNQPVSPDFGTKAPAPGGLQPGPVDYLGNPVLVGRDNPFFSSPEYSPIKDYSGMVTHDMYYSPYFGAVGSGTIGSMQDDAYENYLRRIGQPGSILRQPPTPIPGPAEPPPPGPGGLTGVVTPPGGLSSVRGPSVGSELPPNYTPGPVNVAPMPTVGPLTPEPVNVTPMPTIGPSQPTANQVTTPPSGTIEPILENRGNLPQAAPTNVTTTSQPTVPPATSAVPPTTSPSMSSADVTALLASLPAASKSGSSMSITQGTPLPDITETTTKAQAVPEYYTQYLQDLSQAGRQGLARTAAEGVAPMDVLQTQGYGMVPEAATAYEPGLTAAGQTAAAAAAGFDPRRIGAFMDPYQRQVVDEMARLQQQNIQRSVLPSLKGAFVGRGDLGSQRYATATGQTLADMQRNLMGQQYGALSSGYQNALKAAMDELQIRNQAAQTQARIAEQEQALGLTGAGALTKAGAERQAYEQAKLDYPLKQASTVAGLMRGYQVPLSDVTRFVGPRAGAYSPSPLNQILGVLTTLGAIRPTQVSYDAQGRPVVSESLLKGAYDFFKDKLPSFGTSSGVNIGGAGYPGGGTGMSAEEAADYFGGFAQGGLAAAKRKD